MTYFEGFIVPVPEANRDAYLKHATGLAPIVQEIGVRRMVETWEDDVPEGKVTDFRKAVDAKPGREDRLLLLRISVEAVRDAANEKFMSDPRMAEMGKDMPFDGKRMIMGGFEAIVEEGQGGGGYTDGFVVPVLKAKRDAYRELAAKMAKVFRQHGATRVIEAFGDDVPKGEVTDFYRAVKAEDGEGVVFSFIEWPDKATRDQAWKAIMEDESLRPQGEMPFDGKRMFWGGFEKIVDTGQGSRRRKPALRSRPDRPGERQTSKESRTMTDVRDAASPGAETRTSPPRRLHLVRADDPRRRTARRPSTTRSSAGISQRRAARISTVTG